MEKLVDLLNEMEKGRAEELRGMGFTPVIRIVYHYDKEDEEIKTQDGASLNFDSLYFIQDFLKRLIDNDKINLYELNYATDIEIYHHEKGLINKPVTNYERLIMLFVINDEPINFLTSLFK